MPPDRAKYACDECRARKIRCSREEQGCSQCAADSRECVYSRSGVIRRRRTKQLIKDTRTSLPRESLDVSPSDHDGFAPAEEDPPSQMDYDLNRTKDNLRQFGECEGDASGSLATLDAEYSSFWQGPSLSEMAKELNLERKEFVAFDEQETERFAKLCTEVQKKGRSLFTPSPSDVLYRVLRHPNQILDKAHLAFVYGVLLTEACLDDGFDQTTTTKFRWNLRLSLDDAKLLLEPSDLHIQVLTLLGFHVQELSTPSLCWMLVSTACRMLQVLGVNGRKLDAKTRDRRIRLFWTLNAMDKGLALLFGRSPTLHGAMYANIPPIPLHELLDYRPHISDEEAERAPQFKSMFGAHFIQQIHLSSPVAYDIWSLLYAKESNVEKVRERLENYYGEAHKLLQACQVAETPFLSPKAIESMRLGLVNLEFQYLYYKVLIIRSRPNLRDECVATSREALLLLNDLVSDTNEVFNGVIWILLYSPFTPFFVLFGEVLSAAASKRSAEQMKSSQRSVDAMEAMVNFLQQMGPKHPQAPKLYTVAATFLKYARTAIERSRKKPKFQRSAVQTTASDLAQAPPATSPSSGATSGGATTASETTSPATLPNADIFSSSTTDPQNPQQPLVDFFNDPSVQDLSLDLNFWFPQSQAFDGTDARNGSDMEQVLQNGMFENYYGGNDAYGFFVDSTPDWFSWADASSSASFGPMMG